MKLNQILVFLASLLGFVGCATAAKEGPKAVRVTDDLRFTSRPLVGISKREVAIPAGRYVYQSRDAAYFIYSSPTGFVSAAKPGERTEQFRGGIAIDRLNGSFYVWRSDPSEEGMLIPFGSPPPPNWPLSVIEIGKVPKEFRSKLIVE